MFIFGIVSFRERSSLGDRNGHNDTFHRTTVSRAQRISGTEKYADAGIKCEN